MKYITGLLAGALVMILTGCGSSDEEGTCYFDVQQMIDEGNFQGAIDRLENDGSCRDAYADNSYLINLGVAYMGKAGFGVSETFVTVADASDNEDDTFGAFLLSVDEKSVDRSLPDLQESTNSFETYLDGADCEDPTLSYVQKDACTYMSMADLLTSSVTFTYLTDDVQGWVDDSNTSSMDVTACALAYATGANASEGIVDVSAYPSCAGMVLTVDDSNVTFDSNRSYEAFHVDYNATDHYYVAVPPSTVLTDGYCMTDFTACEAGTAGCYACPVNRDPDGEDLIVSDLLVETLNGGFDGISGLIDDEELQADIDAFKEEIAPGGGDVTVEDIINYLSSQS